MTTPLSRQSDRRKPDPAPAGTATTPAREGAGSGHTLRPDIQGLRALAVTSVVLSHAGVGWAAGGYVGVDVFFVISGFLITSMLLRELTATGGVSVGRFYGRRALRLLPASSLVVVATIGGSWLFLSKVRFAEYAWDAVSSALYAVNFRLAVNGTNYLAQDSPPSPFQHFWSLAVEEQFYLLWPVLLLVSWRLARRRRELLAVPLVVLCAVSFWVNVTTTQVSAPWAYFGSQSRVWELGVGALTALLVTRLERLPARYSAPMTWTGLGGIVLAVLWFDASTPFPGYYALLPVLGAALFLAGGCSHAAFGARWLLARRPVVWLGGLSYGWYLWHWPLLVIGPAALHRAAGVPLSLALCAVALGLAWATLRLVENPVRFHALFRGRPRRALGLGFGLSTGVALVALLAMAFPPAIATGAPQRALQDVLAASPDPQAKLAQLLEVPVPRLPGNLATPLDKIKGELSAVYQDGCHVDYASVATPPCVYGDSSSDRTVVLFGDSHAAQWFPAMQQLAKQHGWKLVSLTKASCKVAAVTIVSSGKPYTACDTWRSAAIARINALRPALVVVSSSDAGSPVNPTGDPLQQWTTGYQATLKALSKDGAKVAAILDTPWPKGDAVDCAAAHPQHLALCTNRESKAIQDQTRRTALRTAAASTGAAVIDPTPWLCTPEGACPVVVGNTFVYRDDSHVADAYAEALSPVLGAQLTAILGADPS